MTTIDTDASSDPWAALDDALGASTPVAPEGRDVGALAFVGRCSTEDHQDPETSRAWQLGNARQFVEPLGGRIVTEFFDIGQSRSVPWERRREASKLLAQLKDRGRPWSGVVVGEGTRCWFGNQFSLVAPRFAAYGVDLWIPELGGRYDPHNPSHKMLMSVLGGMSESERQHVQARVRAAMSAQVLNEGRHQGGRAPYGYVVADGGPHPHPGKAAEGARLRILVVDEPAAEVVRRIFDAYLGGDGDRAIASALNGDGIPCPSAARPDQNRHRPRDGWQGSTVRAILDNPRYTGYAVFGRWSKHETLADPDDVGAGHVTRFRKAPSGDVVRSRRPAHEPIVSVETFTRAKLLRENRAAGGLASRRKLERGAKGGTKHVYVFRGRVRCGLCARRMEGTPRKERIYYRCAARTIAPGSPALAEHPPNVYLPEHGVTPVLNEWLEGLFDAEHRAETVERLLEAEHESGEAKQVQQARDRVSEAQTRLRRLQSAIEAGADPVALVDPLNRAQRETEAATAVLDSLPVVHSVTRSDVERLVERIGTMGQNLDRAAPERVAKLYDALGLEMTYDPITDRVDVTADPVGRDSAGVRGGT